MSQNEQNLLAWGLLRAGLHCIARAQSLVTGLTLTERQQIVVALAAFESIATRIAPPGAHDRAKDVRRVRG
jgi:hypothetical protein